PGPLASEGFNLVGPDPECPGTATDVQRANPLLGSLTDNGGGTDTHLPLAGSPAVDGGDPAGCRESVFTTPPGPVITIDQRGIPRQGRCDIGAAEAQPDLVIEALTDAPDPVPAGGDITYTAVVRNQGAGPATASTLSLLVPDGVVRLGASGPAGACGPALDACPLGEIGPGLTRQATFTVRRAEAGSITVAALVAAGAGVFESSVANNTRQETTTLDLPPPPAPPPPAPAPPPEVEPPGADPPAQTEAPRPATPALGAVVPRGGAPADHHAPAGHALQPPLRGRPGPRPDPHADAERRGPAADRPGRDPGPRGRHP
ncbi:MAG: DUF11 domain-containing protein, partial [Thermoleophilia bacterium]|nr:DUF11 domain-containing protein [Thermoleophilia bacterium]